MRNPIITDRVTDVVKNGGEWISSVLEPAVVVGVVHPRRQLPDEVLFVEEIPKTCLDKFNREVIRPPNTRISIRFESMAAADAPTRAGDIPLGIYNRNPGF